MPIDKDYLSQYYLGSFEAKDLLTPPIVYTHIHYAVNCANGKQTWSFFLQTKDPRGNELPISIVRDIPSQFDPKSDRVRHTFYNKDDFRFIIEKSIEDSLRSGKHLVGSGSDRSYNTSTQFNAIAHSFPTNTIDKMAILKLFEEILPLFEYINQPKPKRTNLVAFIKKSTKSNPIKIFPIPAAPKINTAVDNSITYATTGTTTGTTIGQPIFINESEIPTEEYHRRLGRLSRLNSSEELQEERLRSQVEEENRRFRYELDRQAQNDARQAARHMADYLQSPQGQAEQRERNERNTQAWTRIMNSVQDGSILTQLDRLINESPPNN